MKNYCNLADAMTDLKDRGYQADFQTETFCLYCSDLDLRLDPEDFHVDAVYHFEEVNDTNDNTVVYAISSSFGVKGVMINTHGPDSGKIDLGHLDLDLATKLRFQP